MEPPIEEGQQKSIQHQTEYSESDESNKTHTWKLGERLIAELQDEQNLYSDGTIRLRLKILTEVIPYYEDDQIDALDEEIKLSAHRYRNPQRRQEGDYTILESEAAHNANLVAPDLQTRINSWIKDWRNRN